MVLRGRVKNGVVVLEDGASLADGTLVEVTPVAYEAGHPLAVIAAMESAPHVPAEWVDELERLIAEGKRPPSPPVLFPDEPGKPEGG